MPKRAMEVLTESMFYVLIALSREPMCGIDIAAFVDRKTRGRVQLGPATLYTVLGKFEKEGLILQTDVTGRKRTYRITGRGQDAYREELERLKQCICDAEGGEPGYLADGSGRALPEF